MIEMFMCVDYNNNIYILRFQTDSFQLFFKHGKNSLAVPESIKTFKSAVMR